MLKVHAISEILYDISGDGTVVNRVVCADSDNGKFIDEFDLDEAMRRAQYINMCIEAYEKGPKC